MPVAGLLLTRLGGVGDLIGLVLLFFGVGGLGHAVLYGLGLVDLPSGEEERHTMREMSIFLFGCTVGCTFHLTQTVMIDRLGRRKKLGRGSGDAED